VQWKQGRTTRVQELPAGDATTAGLFPTALHVLLQVPLQVKNHLEGQSHSNQSLQHADLVLIHKVMAPIPVSAVYFSIYEI